MCDVNNLFCKHGTTLIEGYLGNPDECEILFVLREPDDPEPQKGFWFRDVVCGKQTGKTGTKYKNVLGMIAHKLLGGSEERQGDYSQVLRKCAYINAFPFYGKSSETDRCKAVIDALSSDGADKGGSIDCNSDVKAIANNRNRIIKDINCRYIVTVGDIFNAIKPKNATILKGIQYQYRGSSEFGAFALSDNKTVVKFLHPCCWISYDKLIAADFLEE